MPSLESQLWIAKIVLDFSIKSVIVGIKMIPKVKTWKVSFTLKDDRVLTTTVNTINKRFAKSIANETLGFPLWFSKKVTVGLIRA